MIGDECRFLIVAVRIGGITNLISGDPWAFLATQTTGSATPIDDAA
jgi:hypothetical protein